MPLDAFFPLFLLAAAALWLAGGMTQASVAYRRGPTGWHWLAVGAVAGPLAGLVARALPSGRPTPRVGITQRTLRT